MIDVLEEALEQAADVRGYRDFYARTHTYFYQLPTGGTASSRSDRWYTSIQHTSWIRDLELSVPGPLADHNGVTERIGAPSQTVTVRKLRRVHPGSSCAEQSVRQHVERALDDAHLFVECTAANDFSDKSTAQLLASWWYRWKLELRKDILAETRRVKRSMIRATVKSFVTFIDGLRCP